MNKRTGWLRAVVVPRRLHNLAERIGRGRPSSNQHNGSTEGWPGWRAWFRVRALHARGHLDFLGEMGRNKMLALVSNSLCHDSRPTRSDMPENRYRRAWRRIVDWLFEPISFPGQWPCSSTPLQRYNRVEETVEYDQPTPRPRRALGSCAS